ncbi:unnamed protein product [Arctia plantaginis]|nr:unnamed protein product [Arctia plantaginis]
MVDANRSLLVKYCVRPEAPHDCDNIPCDPLEEVEGECPKPYICAERIKNPALPHENTRCLPGSFINVKSCFVPDPDHPCDPPVPCSVKGKTRNCQDPTLCHHRLKNPEIPKRRITNDCDPNK